MGISTQGLRPRARKSRAWVWPDRNERTNNHLSRVRSGVAVSRTTGQILRTVPQDATAAAAAPSDDTFDLQLATLCADAGLDEAALQGALARLRALGVSPDTDLATLLT